MNRPKVLLTLLLVVAVSMMLSCSEDTTPPTDPGTSEQAQVMAEPGGTLNSNMPLSGAIFTTTPDGGVVNENVHYERKIEVYLDGGPGPNAPQHAASLPDGWYVFQVTDPPGKVLLSEDPAKCRVVEVQDGIIVRLVMPSEFGLSNDYEVGNGNNSETYPCHIQDEPDGVAGESGRHDLNTDTDHGENGAKVVQLMPFYDTPNPGGVYKAWMTPFDSYLAFGGDLDEVPVPTKVKGVFVGYKADPGFGPPRNMVKTDNFKVKEVPPMIHVHKFHDLNGNGIQDPGEPEITGWKVYITETLHDGSMVTNVVYTPAWKAVAPGATVTVEEELPGKWMVSHLSVDGKKLTPSATVDVEFKPGDTDHTVVYGNFEKAMKSGYKFHDLNADSNWDKPTEPGLEGWKIVIDGTTGMGNAYHDYVLTDASGFYMFTVPPGTYTVSEVCEGGWFQTYPAPTNGCGSGVHTVTLASGDVHENNNFGNFAGVQIKVLKYLDCNLDCIQQVPAGEVGLPGFEFCLYNAQGQKVTAADFAKDPQPACQTSGNDGLVVWDNLLPGKYTVKETPQQGWTSNCPPERTLDLVSGETGSVYHGNAETVMVTAKKFHDMDGDGYKQDNEPYLPDFEFCLYNSSGNLVTKNDFATQPQPACLTTGASGMVTWMNLKPGVYTVKETPQEPWTPTTVTEKTFYLNDCVTTEGSFEFGNTILLCRVTGGQVDESGNCSECPMGESGPNRYTCGGQAGAPSALPEQPWGEWTHTNHKGPAGRFTFHAGTASAPDYTEIAWITCNDPGYCNPARPAPAKQIDFGGVGTFKNIAGSVPKSISEWVEKGSSLHYFEVNIDDLGEPGKSGWQDPPSSECPPDGYGLHGSTARGDCDCPDFYRIRIYATESPNSDIIYEAEGYIAGGNFQIHPLTGYDTH